jgi:hypothetical protein
VLTLSHSELATFRRCPREHYYRYTLGRESTAPRSDALTKGKQIDRAIESGVTEDMSPEIRALVLGHAAFWGSSCSPPPTHTHVKFRFEFVPGVELVGEVDGRYSDQIYERKSTSESIEPGSPYWERVTRTDPQVSLYLAASQVLGWGAMSVLYDVLKKPTLRKSEAKSRKAPETDAEFEARVLEDIQRRPEHYYQRQAITRTEAELRAWREDVEGTIHLMHVPYRPRNVDSCFKFGTPCEYYLSCGHGAYMSDETLYRTRETSDARKNSQAETSTKSMLFSGEKSGMETASPEPASRIPENLDTPAENITPTKSMLFCGNAVLEQKACLCAVCGEETEADTRVRTWLGPSKLGWRHEGCLPIRVIEQGLVSTEDVIPFDEVVAATERKKRYFR